VTNADIDPRSIDVADVYKGDEPVGVLRRSIDSVEFEYLDAASVDLATTLPRHLGTVRTHAAGALPAFFAGLLPEGRRLSALRAAIKTSADDDFSLLIAVGNDCVGDVSIAAKGSNLDAGASAPGVLIEDPSDWATVDFTEVFERSVGVDPERTGLAGVQDKVSARMITVPVAGSRSTTATHILKLNPPEFPYLVENESFFAEAARRSGLDVCDSTLVFDRHGRSGLLVTRFDRTVAEGTVARHAQEDGCQVLGLYPADKYRTSTEALLGGLVRLCAAAPVAALAFYRQVVFAYLSCNGDAHAKNFSVLRHGTEWRASPAYDVPSSYPYRDNTMALPLNDKRDQRIGRADFLHLAGLIGLRDKPANRAVDDIVETSSSWIEKLGDLPFDERRVHDLRKAIEYRRGRLLGR
jgi:serine/threonine-protein kinase HipA